MSSVTLRGTAFLLIMLLLAGCVSAPKKKGPVYDPFVDSDPRSLLVVMRYDKPLDRHGMILSSLAQSLIKHGYYVLPVRMTKALASEAGIDYRIPTPEWEKASIRRQLKKIINKKIGLHTVEKWVVSKKQEQKTIEKQKLDRQKAIVKLKQLEATWSAQSGAAYREKNAEFVKFFGADAMLYVSLLDWSDHRAKRSGLLEYNPTRVHTVRLRYHLMDDRGQTLRQNERVKSKTIKGGSGAVEKIWTTFANPSGYKVKKQLYRDLQRGLIKDMLVGPYHPYYERDRAKRRGKK